MEFLFLYLPSSWENRFINLVSFLAGAVLNLFIPKWKVNLFLENLLFPLIYRKLHTYNPLTIKRQRKKIEDQLIKLGELFHNQGAAHTSIWFVYKRKGKITGSMTYEYSVLPQIPDVRYLFKHLNYEDDPRIQALWNYIMTDDFPGYVVYYTDDTVENNNLELNKANLKFETTLLIPKFNKESNSVYFHLNVSFTNRARDEEGHVIPVVLTHYQELRIKQILNEVHSIMSSY